MSQSVFGLNCFDLREKSEAGQWIRIKHLNGTDSNIEIELLGPESRAYQTVLAELAVEQAQRAKGDEAITVESVLAHQSRTEALAVRTIVALTRNWRNVPDAQGQPLNFTPELATKLYEEYSVIRNQVAEAFYDRERWLLENAANLQNGHPANSSLSGMPGETNEQ